MRTVKPTPGDNECTYRIKKSLDVDGMNSAADEIALYRDKIERQTISRLLCRLCVAKYKGEVDELIDQLHEEV